MNSVVTSSQTPNYTKRLHYVFTIVMGFDPKLIFVLAKAKFFSFSMDCTWILTKIEVIVCGLLTARWKVL